MRLSPRLVREITGCRPDHLPLEELLAGNEPVVLRGLVADWEMTKAGLESDRAAIEYIRSFYNGRATHASVGSPEIEGRLFYVEDFSRLNFDVERVKLDEFLERLFRHIGDERPPTMYVGSLPVDTHLPGFTERNTLGFAAHDIDSPPSIWIGNRTIASCHYDAPNNIACCVVGRRQFTLFPPEQIFNLYPGPFDPTPGGQAISIVDFAEPDFERFPRFRDALNVARSVEIGPGDAIFVPSMWWHHVQGLSAFNTLVNYWWSSVPKHVPTPMNALYQAIWSLRDRPLNEKDAWREVFEYYVFGDAARAGAHLPEKARGYLGPIGEDEARRLRAMLIEKLNR